VIQGGFFGAMPLSREISGSPSWEWGSRGIAYLVENALGKGEENFRLRR
jgi:hypothetical protein